MGRIKRQREPLPWSKTEPLLRIWWYVFSYGSETAMSFSFYPCNAWALVLILSCRMNLLWELCVYVCVWGESSHDFLIMHMLSYSLIYHLVWHWRQGSLGMGCFWSRRDCTEQNNMDAGQESRIRDQIHPWLQNLWWITLPVVASALTQPYDAL